MDLLQRQLCLFQGQDNYQLFVLDYSKICCYFCTFKLWTIDTFMSEIYIEAEECFIFQFNLKVNGAAEGKD